MCSYLDFHKAMYFFLFIFFCSRSEFLFFFCLPTALTCDSSKLGRLENKLYELISHQKFISSSMLSCFIRILVQENKSTCLLDAIAFNTLPNPSLETLVSSLTGMISNPLDKARAIFTWITYYISFREQGKNQSSSVNLKQIGRETFDSRVSSVSEGYSYLFHEMTILANIKTLVIEGTLRTSKGLQPHTWNAVESEGVWYFVDCLLGSGYFDISCPSQISKVK